MKNFYILLACCLGYSYAQAQTSCLTAEPVSVGTYTVAEILPGEIPEPVCVGNLTNVTGSVWFAYTASDDVLLTVSTDLPQNSGGDTRVHIYSGSCGALACVGGDDDDGSGYLSLITLPVETGQTYYIAFDDRWSNSGFDFTLTESVYVPNPVDFAASPIPLSNSANAVVDMNGDYLDDIVSVANTFLTVTYQQLSGPLYSIGYNHPALQNYPNWSVAAGDIDANGYNDLVFGGGSGVSFMMANEDGTAYTEHTTGEYVFCQRSNMVDINNDGNLDVFVCHDIAPNVYYINDGSGDLSVFSQGGLGDTPEGGNYGSIWLDYDGDHDVDLFIAKCRGGNSPANINQMHRNNGDGTYTEVGEEIGLADDVQTWSSAWADFDNDGDMDVLVGASSFSKGGHKLMVNNGDGTFTDMTVGSGYDTFTGTNVEHIARDFDNDGFVDVFGGDETIMFNNGDLTFSPVYYGIDHGPTGDINSDGFIDLIEGETIYLNQGNENNHLTINLQGTESNLNGIGSQVWIYTANGTQQRPVCSGDGFRYMSSLNVYFGLGTATAVDSIVVYWPSGETSVYPDPEINTSVLIVEGEEYGPTSVAKLPEPALLVYPVPAGDMLLLDMPDGAARAEVRIFEATGKQVLSTKLNSVQRSEINIASLPAGVYVLKLNINNREITRRFVKE